MIADELNCKDVGVSCVLISSQMLAVVRSNGVVLKTSTKKLQKRGGVRYWSQEDYRESLLAY